MSRTTNRLRRPLSIKNKLLKLAGGLVVIAIATVGGNFVYNNTESVLADLEEFVAKTVGAKVEYIMVGGTEYTDPEKLKVALGMEKGDSLVGFDSRATRARVETLPWVRLASVERQLPSTIKIDIYEYHPLARLLDGDTVWVIDKNGHQIAEAGDRFDYLPQIDGENAAAEAAALFSLLEQAPKITQRVVKASFIGGRRWNVAYEGGVTVQLPEKNPQHALKILAEFDNKRHVLTLSGGMVDLRLEDRIVVRIPEGQKMTEKLL